MSLEIDMLDVSCGDAIVVRVAEPAGEWVGLIDGGDSPEDGMKVVEHVRRHTWQRGINDIICSHPDADHIGGLPTVIQNVGVGRVWIHDPAAHIDLWSVRRRWRQSYGSAARKIEKSMQQCSDFLDLLDRRRIPRSEPFAGAMAGMFQVLGPTAAYYEELLQQFEKLDGVFLEDERADEPIFLSQVKEAINPDAAIDEDNETSAENNSSVISRIEYGGSLSLFTGDAGVPALERAIIPFNVRRVSWLDVPHHGSKHNVNSTVLNRLMPEVAYFSAKGTRKHPSVAVINALKRRGCRCYSTHRSSSLLYSLGAGLRAGWGPAEAL